MSTTITEPSPQVTAPEAGDLPVRFRVPGVTAPELHRQAGVWHCPVPAVVGTGAEDPHWWWLGAHGGAGVSTLTAVAPVSGDCMRWWPGGDVSQSPNVVLVCRTHTEGLERARDLLRQYAVCELPPALRVLGLVTVADAPGKPPAEIRNLMKLVAAAAPTSWHLPWVESWRGARLHELPTWSPDTPVAAVKGKRDATPTVPPQYLAAVTAIHDLVQARRTGPTTPAPAATTT